MKTHFFEYRTTVLFIISLTLILCSGCAGFISNETNLEPDTFSRDQYEKVGTVDIQTQNWNWFFRSSAEERKQKIEQQLRKTAEAEFEEDIILKTEISSGKWNPASLIMLFSTAGFVEDAYMQASVWKLKNIPVYGTRYVVIPEDNYTDERGFMLVEYKTREELEKELLEAYNRDDFDEISMKKRQKRLPETGKIFVTIGREDITNAISRWFSFVCTHNDRTIFRTRGIEDIPYVYGTDKLWWNDMSYNVGPVWDGELDLKIHDSYQNRDFNFKIVKEVYEITEE